MTITDDYLSLAYQERWQEALPLIETIVSRAPSIATSWFNFGVCLDALGRHQEAADRFLRAYELEPDNFGAQYRAFRSLFFAADYAKFLAFARTECEEIPGLIDQLLAEDLFRALFERPEFLSLKRAQGR